MTAPWNKVLHETYVHSYREEAFVRKTHKALEELGFHNGNTLACASVCRDEMCLPFLELVDSKWRSPFANIDDGTGTHRTLFTHTFTLSSLAGIMLLGKTGMGAAVSHAVKDPADGRQRYVFYAMPHIGVDQEGVWGKVERPGFSEASSACGALLKFAGEINRGVVDVEGDALDIEYVIMKQKLVKKIKFFQGADTKVPTNLELVELTHEVILEDLEKLISCVVDTDIADYAVFTGVMVHGPGGATFISPKAMYSVIKGEKASIVLH